MGGFNSNRNQVKSQVGQGGWAPPTGAVAFGGELQVTDIANGVVAAGVSFYLENPGPFLTWLDMLTTQAIAQMEQSIVTTFTPVARQQAIDFAKGVISTLLQGRNPGEQFTNLFHFNFKAGVSQFSGQNTQWVPDISPGGLGGLITHGDTGGHEEPYGPYIPSWCPYVGFRYNPAVGTVPHPSPPTLHRVQWVGTTWYHQPSNQPGVWHQWDNQVPPHLLRTFRETGRDANFVYLRDQTPGSNLELALGADRQFYHYTDGIPGWHPDTQGHWQA